MKRLFVLIFCIMCMSCAANQGRELRQHGEARVVAASYDDVFEASRDYLSQRGYEITKTDFASGEIETGYKPGSLHKRSLSVMRNQERGEGRTRVVAKVIKVNEASSKLAIDVFSEWREFDADWQLLPGVNTSWLDRFYDGVVAKATGTTRR